MKKALSILLVLTFILGAVFASGCHKKRRETGDIEVDYGKLLEEGGTVMNIKYEDSTPITFMYPNYFTRSSDEGDSFVAKGPDDNSVLMYNVGELSEGRSYETIAAYTEDEIKDWVTTIQLGLVSSQGVSDIEFKSFDFKPLDDHIVIVMDAIASYSTGLRQYNSIVDYILPNGDIYTVTSFAPASAVEKYGPLFSDVRYKGLALDEALPEEDGAVYGQFDNGTIAFAYNDCFSISDNNGVLLSMVTDRLGLLTGGPGTLKDGLSYDELAEMPNGELLTYLAALTGLPAEDADFVEAKEEDGLLRLEAHYTNETMVGSLLYCVVTQFIEKDGSTFLLFAYMNEPEPIKDIAYIG